MLNVGTICLWTHLHQLTLKPLQRHEREINMSRRKLCRTVKFHQAPRSALRNLLLLFFCRQAGSTLGRRQSGGGLRLLAAIRVSGSSAISETFIIVISAWLPIIRTSSSYCPSAAAAAASSSAGAAPSSVGGTAGSPPATAASAPSATCSPEAREIGPAGPREMDEFGLDRRPT